MERPARRCQFILTSAAILWLGGSQALLAEAVPKTLQRCMAEKDDAVRLACYDQETARLATVAAPDRTVAATPSADARTAEEKFGLRGKTARDEVDRRKAETHQLIKLESSVRKIAQRADGSLLFTLENAQVWLQLQSGLDLRINVGDKVTITPGVLGSFLLTSAAGRSSKVTRLR